MNEPHFVFRIKVGNNHIEVGSERFEDFKNQLQLIGTMIVDSETVDEFYQRLHQKLQT